PFELVIQNSERILHALYDIDALRLGLVHVVYSLIARTRSEILDVLLSISINRFAISAEAAILTSAARATSASRVENNDSSTSGLMPLRARSAASCQRSLCP